MLVGVFMMVTMKKAVVFGGIMVIIVGVGVFVGWNFVCKRRGVLGFVKSYPDAELRGAVDGQYVKVTGVISPLYYF